MNAATKQLDRFFGLAEMGSSVRVEIVAGITTFLAMSYIIAVNPAILSAAGIPPVAAAFATCLVAGLGTIAMGLIARMPLALAPGMGLNAFFAFTVVGGMGLTWQEALGVVFISGVVFVVLTIAGIRQALVRMMPRELLPAIGAGIGLFLLMIGLRNGGIVQALEATIITRGDWGDPKALLTIATVVIIAALLSRGLRAGILVGIVVATIVSIPLGLNAEPASDGSWTDGLFAQDIGGALQVGFLDIIFAMLFVDFFDSLGTVIGLIRRAKLEDETGNVPRLGRILAVDGASTIAGALAGTSTVTTYIESAAGISAGGRTGLTAVVVGVLFLLALPLAALVAIVPESAVAAALVIIAATTVGLVREIEWDDLDTAVPALVTMAGMPLTFSIADGLAMGLVSYSALKILRGKGLEVSWLVHVLAVVFIARYIFIA
ncbi:MAG: NCS2 family permease [Chloroflexota bacterium]|nr:NCS2 family permease [Chloroflexota bacterium]